MRIEPPCWVVRRGCKRRLPSFQYFRWGVLCVLLIAGCDGSPVSVRAEDAFVAAHDGELWLQGQRFRFLGANRYDVASASPGSGGFICGNAYSDVELDRLMAELSGTGADVLRIWAFQTFTRGGLDWSSIDRAIRTARHNGLRLVLTLENEWRDCTIFDPASADGRKSASFYQGGYFAPLGNERLSFRDYVRAIVERYRDEPTVAFWQIMNEAESPDPSALHAFAADVAALVKSIDGNHLVSLGTIGSGQVGTAGAAYQALHAILGIDLVEAHDYGAELESLPEAIRGDLAAAKEIGKPFFIGEAGIAAPTPTYPFEYNNRAALMDAKIAAHWRAGSAGFLVWSFYDLKTDNAMGWDFSPSDPLAEVLAARAAERP
jgi:mannan endo-1,4-beta-mannosidase